MLNAECGIGDYQEPTMEIATSLHFPKRTLFSINITLTPRGGPRGVDY